MGSSPLALLPICFLALHVPGHVLLGVRGLRVLLVLAPWGVK